MSEDLPFKVYKENVDKKIREEVATLTTHAPGKYRILCKDHTNACIEATAHPGYTMLTTPCPIDDLCREELKRLQKSLCQCISGFVPVPSATLHMTVADLISGERWSALSRRPGGHVTFTKRVHDVLSRQLRPNDGDAINGIVRGMGAFPGVVMAVVDFDSEAEYTRIIELRNTLYNDPLLASFGVERRFPFQGHITLGYLEIAPIRGLNEVFFVVRRENTFGWKFSIAGARLYRFPNMSEYNKDGPVYPI